MMSAQPMKFLFDRNLAPEVEEEEYVPQIELSEHEDIVNAAKLSAYEDGYEAGRKAAEQAAEDRFIGNAHRLEDAIQALLGQVDDSHAAHEKAAVQLAIATARKFAMNLVAREPMTEVEGLFRDCMETVGQVPHLVVRLNNELFEEAKERLQLIANEAGFEGRLIVMADPEITIGDCRMEWANGGMVRDLKKTDAEITSRLKTYFLNRKQS